MKLGIVGTGPIVREFLDALKDFEQIEFTAICSRNPNTALEFSETWNIPYKYCSYKEMLENKEIDTIYVALPNSLHFQYSLEALEHHKHVICEKPFTTTVEEAYALKKAAINHNVMIFEAITTRHLSNYKSVKRNLDKLGKIKIVQLDFIQYSSRYDLFKSGETPNVFNPVYYGGALADLNIYNIHFAVGLFGRPKEVHYFPNMVRGIDTSGILIMEYEDFKCACVAAKDCHGKPSIRIQGDLGEIYIPSSANSCDGYTLTCSGEPSYIDENQWKSRLVEEFLDFDKMIQEKDYTSCYELLDISIEVVEVFEKARAVAGLKYGKDN